MSLQYTLYVHIFVVMGVSDCENFSFGYRVVVTLLECTEFVMLCLDTTWYLLGVGVTVWGPLIFIDVVPVGVLV